MFRIGIPSAFALCVFVFLTACGGGAGSDSAEGKPYLVAKPEAPAPGERTSSSLPSNFTDDTPDDALTFDVIAGQTTDAGTVSITNTGTSIDICFELEDGWTATEAHAYASDEEPDNKGAPGKFPFKATYDPSVDNDCFSIPLDDVEPKTNYYVAVHFVVVNGDQSETAWAGNWNDGDPNWDHDWAKRWGGFVDYCPMPMPVLTGDVVTYKGYHYGAQSYWDIRFDNQSLSLPVGSITAGDGSVRYVGWCVDKNHTMYAGSSYGVKLYSTYDLDLDALATDSMPIMDNGNWDFINYMINERRTAASGPFALNWALNGNKDQFQNAIWYFTNDLVPGSGSPAEAMVEDAIANGDNYRPCAPGQWYAIALYPENIDGNNQVRAQFNIIEVDP